jgi:hypothetical protein
MRTLFVAIVVLVLTLPSWAQASEHSNAARMYEAIYNPLDEEYFETLNQILDSFFDANPNAQDSMTNEQRAYLDTQNERIALIIEATQQPHCDFRKREWYTFEEEFPYLSGLKNFSTLLYADAFRNIHDNNADAAARAILANIRMAIHMSESNDLLIGRYVGINMFSVTSRSVDQLAQSKLSIPSEFKDTITNEITAFIQRGGPNLLQAIEYDIENTTRLLHKYFNKKSDQEILDYLRENEWLFGDESTLSFSMAAREISALVANDTLDEDLALYMTLRPAIRTAWHADAAPVQIERISIDAELNKFGILASWYLPNITAPRDYETRSQHMFAQMLKTLDSIPAND